MLCSYNLTNMKIEAISGRLVALLRQKKFVEAQKTLFHDEVISIEPDFHPKAITVGLSNVLLKEQAFLRQVKSWEAFEVSDPVLSKSHFCIRMSSKITTTHARKLEIDELVVYTVAEGKVVKEQFFYGG